MRHRFSVALYDNYNIDAELIDFIVSHDSNSRQEVLRMLLRAGFSTLIKHKDTNSSMFNAVDQDKLSLLINTLSGTNLIQQKEQNTDNNENDIRYQFAQQNIERKQVNNRNNSSTKNENNKKDVDLNIVKDIIKNKVEENKIELLSTDNMVIEEYPYEDDDLLDADPIILSESESIHTGSIDMIDDEDVIDPMSKLGKFF